MIAGRNWWRYAIHIFFGSVILAAIALIGFAFVRTSTGISRIAEELTRAGRTLTLVHDIDRLVPRPDLAPPEDGTCDAGNGRPPQENRRIANLLQQLRALQAQEASREASAPIERLTQFAPQANCSADAARRAEAAIGELIALERARTKELGQDLLAFDRERWSRSFALLGLLTLALVTYVTATRAYRRHERKLIERWESASQRHNLVFKGAASPLMVVDAESRIEAVNPAAERLLGIRSSELLGRPSSSVLQPWSGERSAASEEFPPGSVLPLGVHRMMVGQPSGKGFPVEVAKTSLVLPEGDRALLVVTDISERLEAERRRNEFISTASHELRSPLSAISGSLGLVLEGDTGELSEDTREMVGIANSNANRLILLINDLLDIERISSGGVSFRLSVCDLNPLAKRAVTDMRPLAREKNVTIRLQLPAEPSEACVDDQRLLQVLVNLLSNAIKFSPPDGEIIVDVSAHPGIHRVSVTDNGPGVPDELHPRIFSRFAQALGSRVGTGLGLAISKEIVERLGGSIHCRSRSGDGANFYFDLPRAIQAS
ncbi:PAS domain-containing sensor histidine kinase [Sphingobium lignivorans]|uniref:histidine kinase n=1 Tax=Sphingobium lignivorans TaxID=2735886 RepID=A0ABR6NEF4_9SPHN|nr:PAS domain-containing sensor histidine kinase [Sphingobium lignivorans]MBB5985446.1 PAS domain S-box-containing protein [Sphingobium lignivorans]